MPTNLPPEYYEVEARYRAAQSVHEKVATLEELISTIPKHKGTDKLRADLRRRLSKLKSSAQSGKGVSRQESAYRIDKEGAGQVVLVGPPNVGKSALVAALTNAAPEVSPAPFTTWAPSPGMMTMENVQIQLVDTPPLNPDYVEPALMDLIRRADLILLVVDVQADPIQQLEDSVALLEANRIVPEYRRDLVPPGTRAVIKPLLVLANKCDDEEGRENVKIFCELLEEDWPMCPISAVTGRNVEAFRRKVFDLLQVMRVYSKAPGRDADLADPFILPVASTVEEFAGKVHKDFQEGLKSARVWGSAQYDGQMVARDYVLQDGDIVELHM